MNVHFRQMLATGAALLLASSAAGAGPCILPITGEEPLSEVEAEQPYRLASNPITLPGYDGLLLRPINRPGPPEFYEIVGTTYRPIERPAPGSNIFDGELRLVSGGDYFLPGWDDRALWHLPKGSDDWRRVRPGEKWWGTAYDEGTGDFYAGFGPQAPLLRWDGDGFVPTGPMPSVMGDALSSLTETGLPLAILTLPQAGGTFAVATDWFNEDRRSLWFRPAGEDWARVATTPDLERLAPGLRLPGPFRDADVSEDGQTVRLFSDDAKDASLLLREGPDGWVLDGAAVFQTWEEHRGSGVRLAWIGDGLQDRTEPYLWFFERSVEPTPPVLHVLDPGTLTARPVDGVVPRSLDLGNSISYSFAIRDVPGFDPLFVQTETGWVAFDGSTFTPLPALSREKIGDFAHFSRFGHLTSIQSTKGVFRLTDALGAEQVDTFPKTQSPLSVTIAHLETAGMFVVVGATDGSVHTSRDFVTFERTASPSPITSAVAALPDRPGMLLVGTDGLYTLEAECPPGK